MPNQGLFERDDHRRFVVYLVFVLLLVGLAFARAQLLSTTGIRVTGDGVSYMEMAESLDLKGRAPFVYRPFFPLAVGLLSAGHVFQGFVVVCALSMLAALLLVYRCCPYRKLAFLLAALLFLNYPFLFNASNIGRMDVFVLALQLAFVWLALERKERAFLVALPLAALVKEGLLLSLLPVAVLAFPRRLRTGASIALAAAAFIMIHLGMRQLAVVESSARAYAGGALQRDLALALFREHIGSWFLGLELLPAFGGLLIPMLVTLGAATHGAGGRRLLVPLFAFNLVFPLFAATDLYRAWFELFTPAFAYIGFRACVDENGERLRGALGLALLASLLPYSLVALGEEHLYLQVLQGDLSVAALVVAALMIGLSLLAARRLHDLPHPPSTYPGAD